MGLDLWPSCHGLGLTDRPQVVRVEGGVTSGPLTLNIGSPQGCDLSPLLYNIYTYDCTASGSSTSIIKFADDTVVLGLISQNNEQPYQNQVADLALWCQSNNLALNVNKTKEMVVEAGQRVHPPHHQWGACGEGP